MAIVEIELDTDVLSKISEAARAAALETMEAVKTDIIASQTMPFDQGTMQGSLHTEQFEDGDTAHTVLQTDGPQARRLYFHPEYNFQKGNNPNAGAAWYKPYTAGGEKANFVEETMAAKLKEKLPDAGTSQKLSERTDRRGGRHCGGGHRRQPGPFSSASTRGSRPPCSMSVWAGRSRPPPPSFTPSCWSTGAKACPWPWPRRSRSGRCFMPEAAAPWTVRRCMRWNPAAAPSPLAAMTGASASLLSI